MIKTSQNGGVFFVVKELNTILTGQDLKHVRKRVGITQNELAELVGIKRVTIASIENGTRSISEKNQKLLENFLVSNNNFDHEIEGYVKLISNLKKYQKDKCLNNNDLAKELDIDLSLLSRIINGKRKPSKRVQQKINSLVSNSFGKMNFIISTKEGHYIFPELRKDKLGERIKRIRSSREETLELFGKNFTNTVGKNVISRWEKGINVPDIERLMNIAYLGETTVTFLLYGSYYGNMLKRDNSINSFKKLSSVNLGMRLRKIRKEKRLERDAFGKMFTPKITKWSMDRYENGKDIPNSERLLQYAYLGEVSLSFLVYGI